MLTKSDAFRMVRETLPDDCDVMETMTIDLDYGWVVFPQSKAYIRTRRDRDSLMGDGGVLVEKHSGRMIQFGSAYTTEENLKIYEAGYLDADDFDLVVSEVANMEDALDLLCRLEIVHVGRALDGIPASRLPKPLTRAQVRARLSRLPCRFNLGRLYFRWETLELMKRSSSMRYALVPLEPPPDGKSREA